MRLPIFAEFISKKTMIWNFKSTRDLFQSHKYERQRGELFKRAPTIVQAKEKIEKGGNYLIRSLGLARGIEYFHQFIQNHKRDVNMLSEGNNVGANYIFKFISTCRVFLNDFSHSRVGHEVARTFNVVQIQVVEDLGQGNCETSLCE